MNKRKQAGRPAMFPGSVKTRVPLPPDVYRKYERLAKRQGRSSTAALLREVLVNGAADLS
jgi:hypothetical protein